MFSLPTSAPAHAQTEDESHFYEWAEYNLPGASDLNVLREENTRRAERDTAARGEQRAA